MIKQFTLKENIPLTHDVYELVFESNEVIDAKPGQFITFLLDKIG
jgi:NAD(P)H-flavin reductase